MADEGGDPSEAQRKAAEREAKKAEVRKRLEEAGQKKKKKGFLTPERKKKLRKLLMVKASEDLKRQQAAKESERHKALEQRVIKMPDIEGCEDKGKLEAIYNDLWQRVCQLEEEKYDINFVVGQIDSEINSLTIEVNDLRGKFVKPSLKKVSKYDNKFKKSADAKAGDKQDFRSNLKIVKKDVMESIANAKKKEDKPDWTSKRDKGPAPPKAEEEKAAPAAAAEPAEEPAKEPTPPPAAEEEPEEAGEEEEEEGEEE